MAAGWTRTSRHALFGSSRPKEEFRKMVTSLLFENRKLASLQCMYNMAAAAVWIAEKDNGFYSTHSHLAKANVWTAKCIKRRGEEEWRVLHYDQYKHKRKEVNCVATKRPSVNVFVLYGVWNSAYCRYGCSGADRHLQWKEEEKKNGGFCIMTNASTKERKLIV